MRRAGKRLALQFEDTANEQVVFHAHGAPDGECGNMVSALKLVTNLIEGNKLGVEVKGLTESSKERIDATTTVCVVGGAEFAGNRTIGESRIVCSPCSLARRRTIGGGVPCIRREEQVTARLFVSTSKILEEKMGTAFDGGGLGARLGSSRKKKKIGLRCTNC